VSECNLTTCKHVSDLEREIEELKMIVDAQHNGEGCQLCHCCGEKRHDIAEEDFATAMRVKSAMRSALSEAENELRCFGSFDGHIARWEQSIVAANSTHDGRGTRTVDGVVGKGLFFSASNQ